MAEEPLSCRREEFFVPRDVHYLNCAYLSPHPRTVEAAGLEGIRRGRVPTDFPAETFFRDSDRLRGLFGRLVNAPAERVAILPAVSYGIAVAARNVAVEAGQNVVVAEDQFPSNVYAWRGLARREGLDVRTVDRPGPGEGLGRRWTERLLETVDGRTAVVALPQVHWTDGTRFDLVAVGDRAREVGAVLVVDASQSVGALPFDVAEVRPDALITAGYKWLLGPYSVGLGYFGPRFDGGLPLEETWIGREGSEDFQGLVDYREEYQPGAARYDVGERSNFILVPMLAAALEVVLRWRPERIQDHCRGLVSGLVERLHERGVRAGDRSADRAWHIMGLPLPEGADPRALQASLEARRVHASLRGSSLRISPNAYNDEGDIAALEEALLAVL